MQTCLERGRYFMTPLMILIALVCYGLSAFCVWAERKSRKWYLDRRLLVASGFFFALAIVATGCAIAL